MKKMDKKAFTLIELLVVVAVIGILVLLAAPRFTGYTQKAELIRIQYDTKVMEEEIGTVLINGDDDFNKWKNNMKDLNQLAQEDKLFEKEGFANELDDSHLVANRTVDLIKHASQLEPSNKTKLNVGGELHEYPEELSISETYKVIPERYKDEINSKLKGTFYANSDGKVYYEHVKSLSRILTKNEKPEKVDDLIKEGVIPVADADELNNVRNATIETYGKGTKWEGKYLGGLDKQYIQVADIDLSGYSEEKGWNPIGTELAQFKGTYDGNGYKITELTTNEPLRDYVGLFGYAEGATISNVGLIDNKVTSSTRGKYSYVGGLVGYAKNSTITNSYTTGSVKGSGDDVGGLVGKADSDTKISSSYATGPVTGWSQVGGLVGYATNSTTISNSYATGVVVGTQRYVGGLAGRASDSTIENSYATGSVTGEGWRLGVNGYVGGLVAQASNSNIRNSYATGEVTGAGSIIGGLVGSAGTGTNISNSYAEGEVKGKGIVGGLLGYATNRTVINNSYATGSVTMTGDSVGTIGGLVGITNESTISNSYATGAVKGGYNLGGLVGQAETGTTIINSYATGSVEGRGPAVGGLVGWAYSTYIENSYATGLVTGRGNVGGLVGRAGLVGSAGTDPVISNSYWNKETTNQPYSRGQEASFGKTTVEMKKQTTYTGWEFKETWAIQEGVSYPTLINNPERH